MHILVVSGDAARTHTLEAALEAHHLATKICGVDRADRARDALERDGFDAVVADARLPDGDGLGLIEQVREAAPRAFRLLVAGDAQHFTAPWRYVAAHRCVRPDPMAVVDAILARQGLRRRLAGRANLDLPVAGVQLAEHSVVRAVLSRSVVRRGHRSLIDALVAEPSVAETLCRRARVLGKGRCLADDMRAAVTRLGLSRAVSAAFAASLYAAFEARMRLCPRWVSAERRAAWSVAEVAGTIASPGAPSEFAFASGLLLELGRLFIARHEPIVAERLATSGATGRELCDLERDLYGADHATVGAGLLWALDLPDPLVEALAYHHEPSLAHAGPGSPSFAVHVAVGLVDAQAGHTPGEELESAVVGELNQQMLERWRSAAREQVQGKPGGRVAA